MKTTLLVVSVTIAFVAAGYGLWFSYGGFTQEHGAELQSDMKFLATQSAAYAKENSTYQGFCSSRDALGADIHNPVARGPLPSLANKANGNVQGYICNDSAAHWAVTIPVGTNKYICIDDVIAKAVDTTMGYTWQPGVTLGLYVSQPLSADTFCSKLQQLQTIIST